MLFIELRGGYRISNKFHGAGQPQWDWVKMLLTFKNRIERIQCRQYRNFPTIKSNSKKLKLWNVSTSHKTAFAEAFGTAVWQAKEWFPGSADNPISVTLTTASNFFWILQKIICKNDFQVANLQATKMYDHFHTIWDETKAKIRFTLMKVVVLNSCWGNWYCLVCFQWTR